MALPFSLYDSTIIPLKGALQTLSHILQVAEKTHPDPSSLLASRLHPTMFPLPDQIRLATQFTERVAAYLTDREAVIYPRDNLTSFTALYERIEVVLKGLEGADREVVNMRGDVVEGMPMGQGSATVDMKVATWVTSAAMPNVYFHVVTAYGILRAEGVELGKQDYFRGFVGQLVPEPHRATDKVSEGN